MAKRNGLTEKQQTFARALASGKTQAEAYKEAYDCSGMNVDTIRAAGSKEANKEEVKTYVAELKQYTANEYAVEQTKDSNFIRAILYERLNTVRKQGNDTAVARYMDILNKMNGTYVNKTVNIDEKDEDIKALTTEQLKELINKVE